MRRGNGCRDCWHSSCMKSYLLYPLMKATFDLRPSLKGSGSLMNSSYRGVRSGGNVRCLSSKVGLTRLRHWKQ